MGCSKDDVWAKQAALAYVIALYGELTAENVAPTLGGQNQAVEFILADLQACRAVSEWARRSEILEASVTPARRLVQDAIYIRVRDFLERAAIPSRSEIAAP
jgi:hypothetical protein